MRSPLLVVILVAALSSLGSAQFSSSSSSSISYPQDVLGNRVSAGTRPPFPGPLGRGVQSFATSRRGMDSFATSGGGMDSFATSGGGMDSFATSGGGMDSFGTSGGGMDSFGTSGGGMDSFIARGSTNPFAGSTGGMDPFATSFDHTNSFASSGGGMDSFASSRGGADRFPSSTGGLDPFARSGSSFGMTGTGTRPGSHLLLRGVTSGRTPFIRGSTGSRIGNQLGMSRGGQHLRVGGGLVDHSQHRVGRTGFVIGRDRLGLGRTGLGLVGRSFSRAGRRGTGFSLGTTEDGQEGYYGATGGRNGFSYWGGAGAGSMYSDGGVRAGVANGYGTGSLQMFLYRLRTGTNEPFPYEAAGVPRPRSFRRPSPFMPSFPLG